MTDAKTCGDCKHFDLHPSQDEWPCVVPLPFWIGQGADKYPTKDDERAGECECFERKDAK